MSVVYVSNAASAEISVLRMDADGGLAHVQTVATGGTVMPLAISPDRRLLHAALRSRPYSVSSFGIDSGTGCLRHRSTVLLPDNMAYVTTDRSGRYLLSASYTGNMVSVNAIWLNGVVEERPVAVYPTPPHAHSAVVDPSNRYLFVAALGGDAILQYLFDPDTGRAAPNTPPVVAAKPGAGPRHLIFHPDGRFVYVSNELDGTVGAYEFDRYSGTLALIDRYPALPPGVTRAWTAELRLTPDGRHLYVSERNSSTLAGFRVDPASGALEPIGHTPTETCPRGFAIDPGGRFAVVAGQRSDSVTVHVIDPTTGALTTHTRLPVGRDPNWVEIVDLPAVPC